MEAQGSLMHVAKMVRSHRRTTVCMGLQNDQGCLWSTPIHNRTVSTIGMWVAKLNNDTMVWWIMFSSTSYGQPGGCSSFAWGINGTRVHYGSTIHRDLILQLKGLVESVPWQITAFLVAQGELLNIKHDQCISRHVEATAMASFTCYHGYRCSPLSQDHWKNQFTYSQCVSQQIETNAQRLHK